MARKNGKSDQTKNKTRQKPKRPANPQPDLRFATKRHSEATSKTGQGATKKAKVDLPFDTETIQQSHFQKHTN